MRLVLERVAVFLADAIAAGSLVLLLERRGVFIVKGGGSIALLATSVSWQRAWDQRQGLPGLCEEEVREEGGSVAAATSHRFSQHILCPVQLLELFNHTDGVVN